MQLISAVTLTGTQASITFSGVPGSFTDLVILVSSRQDSGTNTWMNISFNGSTTGFSARFFEGNGSSIYAISSRPRMVASANNTGANTMGTAQIYISNYSTSQTKVILSDSTSDALRSSGVTSWSGTAAITSITLQHETGNFVANSTAYLYGITKA